MWEMFERWRCVCNGIGLVRPNLNLGDKWLEMALDAAYAGAALIGTDTATVSKARAVVGAYASSAVGTYALGQSGVLQLVIPSDDYHSMRKIGCQFVLFHLVERGSVVPYAYRVLAGRLLWEWSGGELRGRVVHAGVY